MAVKSFDFKKSGGTTAGRTSPVEPPLHSTVLNMLGGAGGQYQQLPLDSLDPSPLQTQYFINPEKLASLTDSVRLKGVLQPIAVRAMPGGRYEILAGHCRTQASKQAGLTSIPAIVYLNMDDNAAEYVFHATNLEGGRDLLPSERARGYAAIARLLAEKGLDNNKSTAAVAEDTGATVRTVQRYNRLAQLNKGLLDKVDAGEISIRAANELSYLPDKAQKNIAETLEQKGGSVTQEQARALRQKSENKPKDNRIKKLDFAPFAKYFDAAATKKEVISHILQALAYYEENTP